MKSFACTPTSITLQKVPLVWWLGEVVILGWVCRLTSHRSCMTAFGRWLHDAVEHNTDNFTLHTSTDDVDEFKAWMGWHVYDD